jgi:hypothetical protein
MDLDYKIISEGLPIMDAKRVSENVDAFLNRESFLNSGPPKAKVKYIIEMEEIKTCGSCPFCHLGLDMYGDPTGQDMCRHPYWTKDVDVTRNGIDGTKASICPLTVIS